MASYETNGEKVSTKAFWVIIGALLAIYLGVLIYNPIQLIANPLPNPICEKGMSPGIPNVCKEAIGAEEYPITDPTIYGDGFSDGGDGATK